MAKDELVLDSLEKAVYLYQDSLNLASQEIDSFEEIIIEQRKFVMDSIKQYYKGASDEELRSFINGNIRRD